MSYVTNTICQIDERVNENEVGKCVFSNIDGLSSIIICFENTTKQSGIIRGHYGERLQYKRSTHHNSRTPLG